MSVVQPPGHPAVQLSFPNEKDHRRQIAQGVNRVLQGTMNCTLFVTLDPNASSTTVTDSRISPQKALIFHPQTADAAAALATTYAVCGSGSAVIYHANNSQTDRLFTLGLIG